MSMTSPFVHLHLHSQYSLLDGAIHIKELVQTAKEFGMPAVAVTDHGNMFGAYDFYEQAKKAGIKPILGCEVYVAPQSRHDKTQRGSFHLVLLARTQQGYQNLKYLVSMGYSEGFYYTARIDKELLAQHTEGLIGCSACLGGEVARSFAENGYDKAKAAAQSLKDIFEPGMFFLEVQNNGYAPQAAYNAALKRIGEELDIPLVGTNDCHYLKSTDAKAHEVLTCINSNSTLDSLSPDRHYSDQLYLKNNDEMRQALHAFPEAYDNTLKIAQMCEDVSPKNPVDWPDYQIPEGETLDSYLRKTAHRMLNERFAEYEAQKKTVDTALYRKRLDTELDIICAMQFPGYFLIVQDFILYAKKQGIPVGPGRGSGAGSLVAWALHITNIDPIPYNLLFERFLNPERKSMPDFDVDFCRDRRSEVISYVVNKYGENNVGQIATFSLLKPRSAIRDVGRVMGMSYGEVEPVVRLVPEDPSGKTTLAQVLSIEPRLVDMRASDGRINQLLNYAERLENLNRHAGMHAAGVLIGNKPLWEYVPIFTSTDKNAGPAHLISQYSKDFVENCGLIKFDFLGLKTLTFIDLAFQLVNRRPDIAKPIDPDTLPLDDPKVYRLISSGNTWGVFQLESSGFQSLLQDLKPDCFEDIIAAVALYRPGPIQGGMVKNFIDCKHGRTEIAYPHPWLEPVLRETYGVFVYQEQVMQAVQILAGFSLGSADSLRRAMGNKVADEMARERLQFVEGALNKGIHSEQANKIYDLMEKFAGYGFNKSHSAAYALLTFQTAWLKTYYPVEFETALLSCDCEDISKVAEYIRLGKLIGIDIAPPHINRSQKNFSIDYSQDPNRGTVVFGLGAIKGVGDAALESILESRADGDFTDIFDFAMRVDLSRVNRATIESLIRAGAFDFSIADTPHNRGNIFGALELALERGKTAQRDRLSGQTSLFDALAQAAPTPDATSAAAADYANTQPWSKSEILSGERASCGFFMSGHPMEPYAEEAKRLTSNTTMSLANRPPSTGNRRDREEVSLVGIVMEYAERKTRNGNNMAMGAVEDLEGRIPFLVFHRNLEQNRDALQSNVPLLLKAHLMHDSNGEDNTTVKLAIIESTPLSEVRQQRTQSVAISLNGDELAAQGYPPEFTQALSDIFARNTGRCDAFLVVHLRGAKTVLALPAKYRLSPSDALIGELKSLPAVIDISFQ